MDNGSVPEQPNPGSVPEGGRDPPAPAANSSGESTGGLPRAASTSRSDRRWWISIAIVVVVAVIVVVAGYAITGMGHKNPSNPMGTVLVPAGTLYSLPVDQYNAVIFAQKSASTVEGTITNVGGAQLFVMTPAEYFDLVNTYNVTGYAWTSGPIASDTYYQLEITVPSGSWDLVFANSVLGNTTAIGFYSNLVEYS